MQTVRILLADEQPIVRNGLRTALELQLGWNVCGEADKGVETVEKTKILKPDVVILDPSTPEMTRLEVIPLILQADPASKVLVFSANEDAQSVRAAVEAGSHGYIFKRCGADVVIAGVKSILDDEQFLSPNVCEVLAGQFVNQSNGSKREVSDSPSVLTRREREIVQAVATGKTSKEIASILNISVKTVQTHRSNLMHKLLLHSTAELVVYAVRNKIIEP